MVTAAPTISSVATWNVNSVGARLPLVTQWLENRRPDVLCLQEIKCTSEKFPAQEFEKIGYRSVVFGQPTYNGVAILYRQDLEATEPQLGFPGEIDDPTAARRLVAATIGNVRVIDVYIPNGQALGSDKYTYKKNWLTQLRGYLDHEYSPDELVLLCGDFNVAPDSIDVHDPASWEASVLFSPDIRQAMQQVKDWGFEDSFRLLNSQTIAYSWWDYRQASFRRNLGLRIDHIWLSKALMAFCRDVSIDIEPRRWERPSDHTPVVAVFGA